MEGNEKEEEDEEEEEKIENKEEKKELESSIESLENQDLLDVCEDATRILMHSLNQAKKVESFVETVDKFVEILFNSNESTNNVEDILLDENKVPKLSKYLVGLDFRVYFGTSFFFIYFLLFYIFIYIYWMMLTNQKKKKINRRKTSFK